MKWNWGTGIFIFLTLFLMASAGFIIFAMNQDVNLVHRDYYEKGVDYTEQMNVNARSVPYKNALNVNLQNDVFQIDIDDLLAAKIDSGNVLLFRPSSSKNDVLISLNKQAKTIQISKDELINGRYILKFSWYSEGLRYELDRPVNIQ
ncbi:FixH family protein [Maribellus maritimus]|uniref:FixH family protein n=1 Tax=Maribellus maritimus TaxID=2870838 RepID=UPI001EEC5E99|nr:FixH family protein [Maribellus maritimus]MCG6186588.1 FixH family protein [Maribellus maritimus]